jgi:hypothetical protein
VRVIAAVLVWVPLVPCIVIWNDPVGVEFDVVIVSVDVKGGSRPCGLKVYVAFAGALVSDRCTGIGVPLVNATSTE